MKEISVYIAGPLYSSGDLVTNNRARLRFKVLAKVAGEDVLVDNLDEVTAGKLLWQYKLLGISANKVSYIAVQP